MLDQIAVRIIVPGGETAFCICHAYRPVQTIKHIGCKVRLSPRIFQFPKIPDFVVVVLPRIAFGIGEGFQPIQRIVGVLREDLLGTRIRLLCQISDGIIFIIDGVGSAGIIRCPRRPAPAGHPIPRVIGIAGRVERSPRILLREKISSGIIFVEPCRLLGTASAYGHRGHVPLRIVGVDRSTTGSINHRRNQIPGVVEGLGDRLIGSTWSFDTHDLPVQPVVSELRCVILAQRRHDPNQVTCLVVVEIRVLTQRISRPNDPGLGVVLVGRRVSILVSELGDVAKLIVFIELGVAFRIDHLDHSIPIIIDHLRREPPGIDHADQIPEIVVEVSGEIA